MSHVHAGPLDPRLISMLWIEPNSVEEIAAMHAQLFDPPWSQGEIRKMVLHPGSSALVCKVRETADTVPCPAGFVLGQVAADEAEIITLGVLKQYQRCGLARKLVEALVRAVAKAGASRLFLEVADDNTAAIALYGSSGFVEVARRKEYYARTNAPAADAIVMSLAL